MTKSSSSFDALNLVSKPDDVHGLLVHRLVERFVVAENVEPALAVQDLLLDHHYRLFFLRGAGAVFIAQKGDAFFGGLSGDGDIALVANRLAGLGRP